MARRVLVIDGHPDRAPGRFCHAIAKAYEEGVAEAGGEVRLLRLAELDFPLLRSASEFTALPDNPAIIAARDDILWAQHLVLVTPLWLGSAPALVRAFFEQVARSDFIAGVARTGWRPRLRGKSGRLIVTMGMPSVIYAVLFGAHGVESWRKSIFGFAGVSPVRVSLFGGVEADHEQAARRLRFVRKLGRQAR